MSTHNKTPSMTLSEKIGLAITGAGLCSTIIGTVLSAIEANNGVNLNAITPELLNAAEAVYGGAAVMVSGLLIPHVTELWKKASSGVAFRVISPSLKKAFHATGRFLVKNSGLSLLGLGAAATGAFLVADSQASMIGAGVSEAVAVAGFALSKLQRPTLRNFARVFGLSAPKR